MKCKKRVSSVPVAHRSPVSPSDHFPIVLKIDISLPDSLPRWNFSRADWVKFDHLCKVNLTLDTIELYVEPIVLFTNILCSIAKSCMPRTTAKQKKRCKPWFNTECNDALKARKSALVMFKTNITTDNKINVPAGNNMCPG